MKNALIIAVISSLLLTSDDNRKSAWINDALTQLAANRWPRLRAVSWWHENFDQSRLRIDSSSAAARAYKTGIAASAFISTPLFSNGKLLAPAVGIYHAAFPDFSATEDHVTTQKITGFETLAGKQIAWAYFSNNWYDHIQFPTQSVKVIRNAGRIPFVRLMARSNFNEGQPDPRYSLQKIIDGDFDAELDQWCQAARGNAPLLAEFGTEVNGNWFPWNGQYNGAGTTNGYGDPNRPDGPERFVDAYRHIIDLCRAAGAGNITWFFHVDAYSQPDVSWNAASEYYPGDAFIDWIGVSVYGAQTPPESWQSFSEILDDIYPALTAISNKPVAVLEFGVTE